MAIHYCEIFSIQCFSSRRKKKPKKKPKKIPPKKSQKKSRHTQIQPPNQIFARKMNIDFVTN
jgi:hypothetical protein